MRAALDGELELSDSSWPLGDCTESRLTCRLCPPGCGSSGASTEFTCRSAAGSWAGAGRCGDGRGGGTRSAATSPSRAASCACWAVCAFWAAAAPLAASAADFWAAPVCALKALSCSKIDLAPLHTDACSQPPCKQPFLPLALVHSCFHIS